MSVTNALRVASDRISRQAHEAMRNAEQIRQNEERLQIIRDMAEIGTMDLDFRANTQICSPRFYEMFSFSPEAELTRETLLSRIHPGDRERVASEQEQLMTRGGPFESEYRIMDERGEERWIHARGRLALRDGTPLRLIGAYIDITLRKRNEQALVASEVRFRGTFENAGIGVAHVAFDDRLMLANRGMCVSLGYNEEDLLLRPLKEITFPEDANNDREKRDSTLKGEIESYEVEKRLVRANGSVLWGALTFSLQRDPDSTPSYFIVAVRDITLQRKAQDDLRERLKEIEALYDNTPIGLALVNRHRRFLRVNRAFADMSGFPAMDHVGRGLWEIMPHLKDDLDPAIEQVLTTGQGTEVELSGHTQISPDVKRYWHEKVYPVIGTEGTVKAVGVTVEDVTEDKQAEEHLRFLMRELSHRSKNLLAVIQGMANQTARSVESVEEFRRRFRERLMGLAASHDLLAHRNWRGVSMCKLVYSQLAAFVESDDPRVVVKGPELDLTSGAAEAMGLALHELCTNSVKYGSLRDLNGKVEILWDIVDTTDETDPEDRRFQVNWIEHTPFPITPPGRKGFGWIVIERMAQASLQGKVTMEFPVEGMRWRIDASTACLVPMNSLKPS